MTLTVEAIYENGVLKPAQPLPLKEHETVRITIDPQLTWAERTAGLLKWTGDPEVLRRIADSDVFIAIISPAALSSTACGREFDWAEALARPVLPVASAHRVLDADDEQRARAQVGTVLRGAP